mmetsp:Transcript_47661/g.107267  ORF Transcript_47661/g.107267 Transcript_47661/m.107267 type:complete len:420 (-) Transcript_47661:197-1456(-)
MKVLHLLVLGELSDLADGNCPTLVPQREAAQLGHSGEGVDGRWSGQRDAACNDRVFPHEAWVLLLLLAVSDTHALIQLQDLALLNGYVHVDDRSVARGQHRPLLGKLDQLQLSLELGDDFHRVDGSAEHEASAKLVLTHSVHLHGHVFATGGILHLLVVDVDVHDRALVASGHDHALHAGLDSTLLDLSDGHHGTHVPVAVKHGDPEGLGGVPLRHLQRVQEVQQGLAFEPGRGGPPLLYVVASEAADRQEYNLVILEARRLQEGAKLFLDVVISLLLPLNARVVHLVDGNDELVDAKRLGQEGVLAGLAAALKAGLELALPSRDDEHADVGLGRAADHVGHVGLVPRSVQDSPPAVIGLKVSAADLNRLSLGLLLLVCVHDVRKEPALTILVLGLLLVFLYRPLIDAAAEIQDVATGR